MSISPVASYMHAEVVAEEFMASIESQGTQTLWRIEKLDENDRWIGPYVGASRLWLREGKHACRVARPYVHNELVYKEWRSKKWDEVLAVDDEADLHTIDCDDMLDAIGGRLVLHAFQSLEQLRVWFDAEDRVNLEWAGYKLVEYCVPRAWHFNKQSLYRKDEVLEKIIHPMSHATQVPR